MEQRNIRAETRWVKGTLGQKVETRLGRGCWNRRTIGEKHAGARAIEVEGVGAEGH